MGLRIHHTKILLLVSLIILTLGNCITISSGFPSEPENPLKAMEYIDKNDLLAYIEKDSDTLFVAQGFEKVISEKLEAKIEGDIWLLKEENFAIKRPVRLLDWRKWSPKLYVEVAWTYLNNNDCEKRKKGEFVNFYNNKGRFIRSYKVPEDSYWCIKNTTRDGVERVCRTRYPSVRGNFWTRPNGRGREIEGEDRNLAICRE